MTRIVNDLGPDNTLFLALIVAVLIAFIVSHITDVFTRETDRAKTPDELAAEQIAKVVEGVRCDEIDPLSAEGLIAAIRGTLGAAPDPKGVES